MTTKCEDCPLRRLDVFKEFSKDELIFMDRFKTGELIAQPGTEVLAQDASSTQLYTALSGMGLRHKTLEDGSRQVVGFVLPGDFVGLQTGVMDVMRHSVEATTQMTLCVFNRSEIWSLFKNQPQRAFALTHLAAQEESLLGEALTAVGQLDGMGKVAWALHRFFTRLTALDLNSNGRVPMPYRQQDLADALGLSLVHTNKTLAKLRDKGIASWSDDDLVVHDEARLAQLAHVGSEEAKPRPLI
ncbi:Crp/Fnr family transcriptional regulator [Marivita hallyeonensis]|uniref:cAMP-binding domain of CRP or a regulatory subunit of cAMP-dependent protein kinases n=1 Tax=Marivita hallyeonensis TaxID=996342 RepID=A0A1M5MNW6_9RHOB|nr:Crp/Fnr family transcriptional regulator [Marivita hallyeonensis]SHG78998.1 cAMP-binding domain of CRP or a regulatory subunit of cAMP-dependent protein kinases [Marivita hallyeonensis]